MSSYFAVLNGTPIYAISKKDYINGMLKKELDPTVYYMVVDADNMMFSDGELYGKVVDKGRGVKKLTAINWRKALKYEEPKILSERPTVEAMATEGSRRLKAVLDEAPVAKASAEAKLNELVAEGNKAVEKVVAEGETIRKNVSTTPAETPVKRKRTNPSSRKRTSV